ncbi:MAG: flagellar hook-associated protein FlgK [Bdellovibrionales bacterium]|nr:flagellar hook-associated protein FlgK [Bdellovibrionales bacterium]
MSRIWSMMDVGKRSMMNSQSALQTVSHNVANKNTEGYSRQRVELQSAEPTGQGKMRMGNGAKATGVTRVSNQFLEKQVEKEGNVLGKKTATSETLTRVEQVFNEQMNKGLNKFMGEFFNSFREMSNSPENLALRNLVKESADFMTKDFQRIDTQLKTIQSEVDFQMATEVSEVNGLTREIAQLNDKIKMVELNALEANDERDRRDLLIKQLSEKLNIRYGESEDGIMTITAGNTGVLVSGSQQRDLFVAASAAREGKREGTVDVFYKPNDNSTAVNLTDQITGGRLGGLIEIRDEFINKTMDGMDEMAYTLANQVNSVHHQGYDRYNNKGQDFFHLEGGKAGAASRIKVSDAIHQNAGFIVAAAQPFSSGDNRIANMISSLQYEQPLAGGESTFDDFYANIVGNVGISANRANSELDSQKGIVDQLKNIRESISGVSLDEETAKMIEFQKSFDASARLIRTADEMMDTVLNLKHM